MGAMVGFVVGYVLGTREGQRGGTKRSRRRGTRSAPPKRSARHDLAGLAGAMSLMQHGPAMSCERLQRDARRATSSALRPTG